MMNDDMTRAVDSLAEPTDPSIFVASNGLRFKLRRVSKMVMLDAARRLQAPKPPRTFMEEKGREEENPADPNYLAALRDYRYDTGMLAVSTYFILGTRVEGELPPGVEPVTTEGWVDELKSVDPRVDIPSAGPRRYLAWLKYHALPDEDQNSLLQACVRYSGGTLEADVTAAQASFRNQPARDTTNGVHDPDQGGLGNNAGTPTGNGAGLRGEGSSGLYAVSVQDVGNPSGK